MLLPQLLIFFHGFVSLKGVSWPSGAYGIPQSQVGCPDEEGVKWQTGWRRQHLEKQNKIPKPSHLNASLVLNGQGIERSFCIKTIPNNTEERNTLWQAGRYCIYKYGESCPQGLKTGYFRWDDVNNNNKHSYGGILPAGSYNNDTTTIKYCCQDGGNVDEPIELPIDKPFYLLPYNLAFCQHVKWTVRTLEMVVYDTENLKNNDSSEGHHGHVKQKKSLVTAYYCYYKACRVTLRNTTGSFESYNSAHQYCSWAIVAREMFVISLKFTELSIPDCQLNNLDIYEGHDEKGVLLARYCGSNATKSVSLNSTGNALFVMLKSGGNFDGLILKFVKLKAEYTAKVACHVELGTNAAKIGSFTSPMYPSENYPDHQNCSWKVVVKENHFISLTFDYFHLPNCNESYVKIYNGPSTMSPLLTKLCDTETATRSIWNSTGKSLYIVYKTGGRSGKGVQKITGFSANYIKLRMFKVLRTTKQDIKRLPTTEKPSVETPRKLLETTLDTANLRNNPSSRSNKVTVIVMASAISALFLLLVIIFVGLYIKRRSSPFNQFLSKPRRDRTRKESVNPIYGQVTSAISSQNPLYSSTTIPVYEEANVKRDFLISLDKDQVSFSSQAKTNKPNGANDQHHYEIPKLG